MRQGLGLATCHSGGRMKNILTIALFILSTIFLSTTPALAKSRSKVVDNHDYAWRIGAWSKCSAIKCGANGVQHRSVQCLRDGKSVVADKKCESPKPAVKQACAGTCQNTTTTTVPKTTTTTMRVTTTTLPVVTTTTVRATTTTIRQTTTTTLPVVTTTTIKQTTTTTLPVVTTTTVRATTTTTTQPVVTTTTIRATTTTTLPAVTTTTVRAPTTTTTMVSGPIGGGGAIISGHPRLWLSDSANFSRIKSSYSAGTALWKSLQSFCDNTSSAVPMGNAYQGDLQFQRVASFALCYQVSGNATYAQKAIALLTTNDCANLSEATYGCSPLYFSQYSTDSGYGIRNYVPALAIAYDWLYDYMGNTAVSVSDLSATTLRGALIQRMNGWLDWYAKSGYCRIGDGNCVAASGTYNGLPIANYFSGYLLGQVVAAVAIGSDDSTGAAVLSKANSMYQTAMANMDYFMPEGHHPEGSYAPGVYERFGQAATAFRWGTGDASYLNSKWLSNYAFFKLGAITSDGSHYVDDGWWHADKATPSTNDSIMSGYAYGWGSTQGQYVMAYLGAVKGTSSPSGAWQNFLFYDPSAAAIALSSAPRSYIAGTYGLATMRSDWSSTGTWASLKVGRWLDPEGEAFADAGQMEIYKGGSALLVNAGFGDDYGQAQADTSFLNTFTFENRTDGGGKNQPWFSTASCPNPAGNDPIGMKKFSDGGDYVMAAGEFSAAYQSGCSAAKVPANFLVRNKLFVRPGLFFVYDQVSVKSGVPTEHFHFPTNAVANGNNQWSITNGSSVMHMASIAPAVTVNIASQPANSVKYSDESTGPIIGNYHMTMAASTQTSYQGFLNVFRAALSSGSQFPAFANIAPSVGYGVKVSGLNSAENATSIVAVFADNSQNTPNASVSYVVASEPGVIHYVALLQANTLYMVSKVVANGQATITIQPSSSGNITSDASGVLRFTE